MGLRLLPTALAPQSPEAAQDLGALMAAGGSGRPVTRAASGTDLAPPAWPAALAGEVWVPGAFAKAALVAAGADAAALRVVPPVVDTAAFTPEAPAARPEDARGHVLLAIVDWLRASGWDVLLRAYAREFGPEDDVTLVVRAWSSLGYTPHSVGEMAVEELEADGHDIEAMPDLILEVGDGNEHPEPEAYRGADCVVAPGRADAWGRRPLEAMACGVPVIATAWAAGEAVLPPGWPLAVPAAAAEIPTLAAREMPQLATGRWGEPDVDALRRLLRASYAGELADAGAAGRAHVVQQHAAAGFRAPAGSSATGRPAGRPRRGCDPREVSVVVQGPVERTGLGRTALVCESIREHLPGAEIVLSTWEGTSVDGLDADVLVQSEDPGPVEGSPFNANTNRLLVSSLAGVRAATRPLAVKLRSDLLFASDTLLDQWGRWEERGDELRVFERRLLVPDVFTRRPSLLGPYPLHPSDWACFGLRSDLETLFGAPLLRPEDSTVPGPLTDEVGQLWYQRDPVPAYSPEQWIWVQAMRRANAEIDIAHLYDVNPDSARWTEVSFANNLAVLDTYLQFGIWCPKYPWANRRLHDITLLQHPQWRELYDVHARGEGGPWPDELLARLAKGRLGGLGAADASALRRAGLPWEAQLLECVLAGPRIWRDPTTGGAGRWRADERIRETARDRLRQAASRARSAGRAATAP